MKARKEEPRETMKKEPYEFVAYLSGPLVKYDLKAKDINDAYGMGYFLLSKKLEEYGKEVTLEKIEILKCNDIPF